MFSPTLRNIIHFVNDKDVENKWGYIYACMMLLVGVVQSICVQKYFQGFFVLGMKVKSALTAAIYRKVSPVSCLNHT